MTIKIWLSGTLLRISDDDHDYHVVAYLGEGVIREEKHDPEGIVLTGNMLYQALTHLNSTNLWKQEVRDFLKRGNVVSAVKLWREKTGLGLKEAKDEVYLFKEKEGL